VTVVHPAGKDGVGRGADRWIFLIAGGDLTKVSLGRGEELLRELKLGKVSDDGGADGGAGGIEMMDDSSVDGFVLDLCVSDGVDGAGEAIGGLIGAVEKRDDCGGNGLTLRPEAYELEHYAGADGADGVLALEIGGKRREDGVGRLVAEASKHGCRGAADVGVVIGEVGSDAGDLRLEER